MTFLCSRCDALSLPFFPNHNAPLPPECPNRLVLSEQINCSIRRLKDYNDLTKSAGDGCEACRFFLDALDPYKDSIEKPKQPIFLVNDGRYPLLWELVSDLPGWANTTEDQVGATGLDLVVNRQSASRSRLVYFLDHSVVFEVCVDQAGYLYSESRASLSTNRICTTRATALPSSESSITIMRSWMESCLLSHDCPKPLESALPKRLIYVPPDEHQPLRLIKTNKSSHLRYAVLSHCWGGLIENRLLQANLAQFLEEITPSSLAQNFQDAVFATRALNLQYIWIDALCIIQDSAEDWQQQAPLMGSIYHNATISIAATSSSSSNEGFIRPRPRSSPPLGVLKDRYLRVQQLGEPADVRNSKLNTRGWTAQESLMSPRTIHFASGQIFWECAEATRRECMPDCALDISIERNPAQQALQQSFLKSSMDTGGALALAGPTFEERLSVWAWFVSEYSPRQLTYPKDKLPAIAALASSLNRNEELGNYCAGLWSGDIFVELAWSRSVGPLLGLAPVSSGSETSDGLVPSREYRAPSWSWAAYEGPVSIPEVSHSTETDGGEALEQWQREHLPKLLEVNIKYRDSEQPYMEVLPGSSITIEGSCREMDLEDGLFEPKTKLTLVDKQDDEDLDDDDFNPTLRAKYEPFPEEIKEYLGVILYLHRSYGGPHVQALVLEKCIGEDSWRRAGLFCFAGKDYWTKARSIKWQRRTLKLV